MNAVIATLTLALGLKKPKEEPKRSDTPRPSMVLTIPEDNRPLSPFPSRGKIDRSFSFSMDRTVIEDQKRISYVPFETYEDEE